MNSGFRLRKSLYDENFQDFENYMIKKGFTKTASISSEIQLDKKLIKIMLVKDRLSGGTLRDCSHFHLFPYFIFRPKEIDELQAIVDGACKFRIPLTLASGKTGLSGAFANFGILVDMEVFKYLDEDIFLDLENEEVTVNQNVLISDLIVEIPLMTQERYIFPIQPSSAFKLPVRVGGLIGTNASGVTSGKLGATKEWLSEITCLKPDGSISKVIPSHPLFDQIVGGNGYYGIVLCAKFRLHPTEQNLAYKILIGKNNNLIFQALQIIQDKQILPLVSEFIFARNEFPTGFKEKILTYAQNTNQDSHLKLNSLELSWAILIKGKQAILKRFQTILQEHCGEHMLSLELDELSFADLLAERTSMALLSLQTAQETDYIMFPGFEDVLAPPKDIPKILNDVSALLHDSQFQSVQIGYGHLNFRQGRGALLHLRLPLPVHALYVENRALLRMASKAISEVILYLKNQYGILPKAEHTLGPLRFVLEQGFAETYQEALTKNEVFFNPHYFIVQELKKKQDFPINSIEFLGDVLYFYFTSGESM